MLSGKTVSAYALLPCLEGFTRATWLELDKAYVSTSWFDPLWSALNNAALSDSPSDTGEQKTRDYYIGKAYLTSDGAYTEGAGTVS